DVIADPHRPSSVPGYTDAGAALADILYTAQSFGGHGGLANTRDGVSDVRLLATLLASYDRWWPRAALGTEAPPRPSRTLPVLARVQRRRIEAETVPPLPCTDVSGHASKLPLHARRQTRFDSRRGRPDTRPRMRKRRVAVVGATGVAGQQFLASLAGHPWFEV